MLILSFLLLFTQKFVGLGILQKCRTCNHVSTHIFCWIYQELFLCIFLMGAWEHLMGWEHWRHPPMSRASQQYSTQAHRQQRIREKEACGVAGYLWWRGNSPCFFSGGLSTPVLSFVKVESTCSMRIKAALHSWARRSPRARSIWSVTATAEWFSLQKLELEHHSSWVRADEGK